MPGGRPSTFTDEIAAEICQRLAEGESLISICNDAHMPTKSGVMKWLWDGKHGEFVDQYARAREQQAEILADSILTESDKAQDNETAAAARVRVDARKWIASKLLPKKYGDRQALEVSGPGGGPIKSESVNRMIADETLRAQASQLYDAIGAGETSQVDPPAEAKRLKGGE